MRKVIALITLALALSAIGCACPMSAEKEEPAASGNIIKCATCGVEFTNPAGLEDHIRANPTHKAQ